jgi:hypothetical protein
MPTTINASDYQIELRDKDGNFKGYLTPWISKVTWEWNRIGGCGRCSITLQKAYRGITFDARDDIRIRIKSGTTSKLVYRGYIANITPTLKINQDITLDVRGYFDLLKSIVVHTSGDTRTYTDDTIAVIVDDIADTFIVAKTDISLGTIDTGSGSASVLDSIEFLCTVDEALRTLADICGDSEYGVDEDLVFYWRTESTSIRKFLVGDDVNLLERRNSFDNIINKIYLVGGDVDGVKFKQTMENTDSQSSYGLSETIINNSSIVTASVANQYMAAILWDKSVPKIDIRAQVKNTDIRLEDTIPMGEICFFDATYDEINVGNIIGETGDGGSNITIGSAADGGSGVIVGGQYSAQVNRLSYTLSNTPGKFNVEIELGDMISETAAKIKKLERELASVTQY